MKKSVFIISCVFGLIVGLIIGVIAVGHPAGEIEAGTFEAGEYIFKTSDNKFRGKLAGQDSGIKFGVMGKITASEDNTAAVYGLRVNSAWGALGYRDAGSHRYGVYGKHSNGNFGYIGGESYGLYAYSSNNHGVFGGSTYSTGVRGQSFSGYGVYGKSITGYAGYFEGGYGIRASDYHAGNGQKGLESGTCNSNLVVRDGLIISCN